MKAKTIELYHPRVNDGNVVRITVGMTEIHCSPPNRAGLRRMDDIDISVPLKSDEHRILHEFDKAISGQFRHSPRTIVDRRSYGYVVCTQVPIHRRLRAIHALLLW